SENNTGEVAIEKEENIALLHKALQKLSVEKREIIVLSKLKELKYKEVGAIIGCTEDTARMKAHRALKELKTVYFTIQN
ncbi:MAG: sigma-70 family RNA polymerase sigma factor, partial [Bacteroidetes bacterium]|nr:sigma-70 family RNA polymerase sigma factor [Bacteroidota bacterium]